MTLEIVEDDNARTCREQEMRKELPQIVRACLVYGLPLSMATGLAFHLLEPSRPMLMSAAVLVPFLLAAALSVGPLLVRIQRNRWTITDSKIRVSGQYFGSVRWHRIVSWSVKTCPAHPGHYRLRVATWYSHAVIFVSQQSHPQKVLEDLFRTKTKTEPDASDRGGLSLSLFPNSRIRRD
jgi:hypothetical protein